MNSPSKGRFNPEIFKLFLLCIYMVVIWLRKKKGGEPKGKATWLKREWGFKAWLLKHKVIIYDFKWGICVFGVAT